jgi:hypothetical protein
VCGGGETHRACANNDYGDCFHICLSEYVDGMVYSL